MAGIPRPKIKAKEYCIFCDRVIMEGQAGVWYHLPDKPYQDNNYKVQCLPHPDSQRATPPVSVIQTEDHLRDLDDIDALLE